MKTILSAVVLLAVLSGVELTVGRPERDARNPLLSSDQPWENATNNYYPNVTWDAPRGAG
ncbi:MAG: hypothetical protein EBR81_15550 [Proteobacteria bacterium]|nr:hypothetical protein [Pseudomonadota bacterium]